jgi:hypothetical protein
MAISSQECAKCGGVLEQGYAADCGDAKWVEGNPKKSKDGVDTSGCRKYKIQAWRCMSCGYTEFYADEEC